MPDFGVQQEKREIGISYLDSDGKVQTAKTGHLASSGNQATIFTNPLPMQSSTNYGDNYTWMALHALLWNELGGLPADETPWTDVGDQLEILVSRGSLLG